MVPYHLLAVFILQSVGATGQLEQYGVQQYSQLGDLLGENADPQYVFNISNCDGDELNGTNITYAAYGGYYTANCDTNCTGDLASEGCWRTGVFYDETVCLVATQAGIIPGTNFVVYVMPYVEIDLEGCNESGVDGTGNTSDYYIYKLMMQDQIGNMTGVFMNDTTQMPDIFVVDDCSYSPYDGPNASNGWFGYGYSYNALFEMMCSTACTAADVPPEAEGCPWTEANKDLPFCVGASMLGIPPMSPFVVQFGAYQNRTFTGCNLSDIIVNSTPPESYDDEYASWWIRAARAFATTTTTAAAVTTTTAAGATTTTAAAGATTTTAAAGATTTTGMSAATTSTVVTGANTTSTVMMPENFTTTVSNFTTTTPKLPQSASSTPRSRTTFFAFLGTAVVVARLLF